MLRRHSDQPLDTGAATLLVNIAHKTWMVSNFISISSRCIFRCYWTRVLKFTSILDPDHTLDVLLLFLIFAPVKEAYDSHCRDHRLIRLCGLTNAIGDHLCGLRFPSSKRSSLASATVQIAAGVDRIMLSYQAC